MTERNTCRGNRNDPDFDLDQYIREKAGDDEGYGNSHTYKETENEDGSFFRNSFAIALIAITLLLYFNKWSPKQIVGNIFGIERFQDATVQNQPLPPAPASAEITAAEQARFARDIENEIQQELQAAFGPEQQQAMEEAFDQLSEEMSTLFDSGEFQQLQLQGIQAATQALQNLSTSGEYGEEEQQAIEDAVKALEDQGIMINDLELTYSEYREALTGGAELTDEEIADLLELYITEVPVDFVKVQHERDSDITYKEILEAFNQEG